MKSWQMGALLSKSLNFSCPNNTIGGRLEKEVAALFKSLGLTLQLICAYISF